MDEYKDFFSSKKEKTEWDFIIENLVARNMTIKDLKDIFGVSDAALAKWEKGEPLSRDKKIFLAKMFGLTIDQYYNKEFSKEYINALIYKLEHIVNSGNYKNLTELDMDSLFENRNKIYYYIEEFFNGDFIPVDEFDYMCKYLQVSYSYEIVDNDNVILVKGDSYLNFESLSNINNLLNDSWDKGSISSKFHFETRDLVEIVLRSENIKYIHSFVVYDFYLATHDLPGINLDPRKYMDEYERIKKDSKDFDVNGMVFKTLITIGASFWNGSERDINKTYYYLKEYIEKEIYSIVDED